MKFYPQGSDNWASSGDYGREYSIVEQAQLEPQNILSKSWLILKKLGASPLQIMQQSSAPLESIVCSLLQRKKISCIQDILEITSERYDVPIDGITISNTNLQCKIKSTPSAEAKIKRDFVMIEDAKSLANDINEIKDCFLKFLEGIEYQLYCLKCRMDKNDNFTEACSLFEEPLKGYKSIYETASGAIKKVTQRHEKISDKIQVRINSDTGIAVGIKEKETVALALNSSPKYLEIAISSFQKYTQQISTHPKLLQLAISTMKVSIQNFRKRYNFFAFCCSTDRHPDYYETWLAFEAGFILNKYRFIYNNLHFIKGHLQPIDQGNQNVPCLNYQKSEYKSLNTNSQNTQFHFSDGTDLEDHSDAQKVFGNADLDVDSSVDDSKNNSESEVYISHQNEKNLKDVFKVKKACPFDGKLKKYYIALKKIGNSSGHPCNTLVLSDKLLKVTKNEIICITTIVQESFDRFFLAQNDIINIKLIKKKIEESPSIQLAQKRDFAILKNAKSVISDSECIKKNISKFCQIIKKQTEFLNQEIAFNNFKKILFDSHAIYGIARDKEAGVWTRSDQILKQINERISQDKLSKIDEKIIAAFALALDTDVKTLESAIATIQMNTQEIAKYPKLLENADKEIKSVCKEFEDLFDYFCHCCSTFQRPNSYSARFWYKKEDNKFSQLIKLPFDDDGHLKPVPVPKLIENVPVDFDVFGETTEESTFEIDDDKNAYSSGRIDEI